MKGKSHSAESRQKISRALKGRKLSDETRKKMSLAQMGHSFRGKKGYKMSDEARANIKQGIREKRYTEEYAKKLSERQRGENNNQAKLTWELVRSIREEYEPYKVSQQSLADKYNVHRSTIADIVNFRIWKEPSE